MVAPVKAAMEFEKALGNIKSVVKFPKPEGLSQLGNTLTSLSMKIPMTATELAKIAAVGGRFGVALKELPFFTEEVAKSAKAWGMTADEASEKVGNLTKTFNLQAKELPYYFDAINHLGNLTGATAKDIPAISSMNAKPYKIHKVNSNLVQQLISPVRWTQCIEHLIEKGENSLF